MSALSPLKEVFKTWVSKVQRFASIVSQSPRRLFSRLRSLPSSLKKCLRAKLLSLLDVKGDVLIKDSLYINFVGDYIGGGVLITDCTNVTFSQCTVTAPPGKTPLVVGGSTLAIPASKPPSVYGAFPNPPAPPLEVVERTTPIVGFRGWLVVVDKRRGFLLGSTAQGYFWDVATNHAWCLTNPDHVAPVADCECGLYLMRRLDDVATYTGDQVVYGAVVSWGRIIEHTDGFRAEYARPLALVKDSPLAEQAGELLGIPVVAREYLENYAKEFGEGLVG